MANRTDTEAVVKLVINGQQAMASLKELTDTQRKLNSELRNMKPSDPGYKKMLEDVQMVSRAVSELNKEQKGLHTSAEGVKLSWKGIAAGILSAGLLEKGINLVTDSVSRMKDALAETSMNRAVLTNALGGDAKAANESLKMLMDFAAKTPEGLQQATDGYLKLVNRGIKPAREEMVEIGDVAASQKKTMDQYIEAILDAQTGENERLKEFGIQAKKSGDTVSFTFKGVTKEVNNSAESIYKALLSFGNMDGVKGTMDVMSKELNGISSNIDDTWDQIFTKLGQKSEGFIYGFYNTYSKVLSYINSDLLSTESAAEKLNNSFKEQAAEVNNLQKNINPLLTRYDELKSKGKLNKDEQVELKKILNDVAATIPGAVTEWDKYGNALSLNTTKARDFIKVQQALLQNQNKSAIEVTRKELAEATAMRDKFQAQLNRGTVTVNYQGGGQEVKKLTDEGIRYSREQLTKYAAEVEAKQTLLKGLTGDYMNIKPATAPPPTVSTARTEGVIGKEIEQLKDLRKQQDVHSKAYADYTAKIEKLEEELAGAKGKKSAAQKQELSDEKKALAEFERLDKEQDKLDVQHLEDQLSKNQKEIEQEARKYDELIKKERDFLKMKGATPEQKKQTEQNIVDLTRQKQAALNDIAVRQEQDMMNKIAALRAQLTAKLQTELEKEQVLINKFYDDQEAAFASNQPRLDQLKIQRAQDLTDAELREKKRLEEEKLRLEAEYLTLTGSKGDIELANINKKYDDQLAALKKSYSAKLIATAEYEAAVKALEANRDVETAKSKAATEAEAEEKEKQKKQQVKDAAIQGAQAISDAVFQIGANNRQRETDIALNALEKQRDAELSKKNLTEKQKAAINKKYDDQAKAIKLKQWKADKEAAIIQAVINGALAVTKALPNIPLAIASGVAAAAQLAVIIAQKPPEFAKGVRNFEGGPALVGEEGMEAIEENGKLWLTSGPTVATLEPGANVYTADETASMLSLGEKLYQQPTYTVDNDTVRAAERKYRSVSSAPSFPASSSSSTGSNAAPADNPELKGMAKLFSAFIEAQTKENQKPVVLDYRVLEEKQKELEETRNAQGVNVRYGR